MADVTLTIDGQTVTVPQGTTILQAAKMRLGMELPHYCYHPGLSIAGNCRICLVEVEKMPKLVTGCSTQCGEGMVVHTQSARAKEGRSGVLEIMLTNHPLDCPICDQAGECKLQDYYMTVGMHDNHVVFPKVHKKKIVPLPPHIVLDQERCILCSRCVRFCQEITKTNELTIAMRGTHAEIEAAGDGTIDNGYAGNLHEICPVGALTSTDFRFQARVWWLKSHKSVCPGCSTGCNTWVDDRRGEVKRLRARENAAVNQWWLCDEGRYGYKSINAPDRLKTARVKTSDATPEVAIGEVWARLKTIAAKKGGFAGIASAQASNEDLFVFRRLVTHMGGIADFRIDDSHGKTQTRVDELLRRADKNPNTTGAKLLWLGDGPGVEAILKSAADGKVAALYVLDADRFDAAGWTEKLRAVRSKIEFVVMHATRACAALDLADVVLPAATYAEKDGTFTNYEGRVQRFWRAIRPVGDARSDGAWLAAICAEFDAADATLAKPAAAFNAMASVTPALGDLRWETIPAEGALIAPGAAAKDKVS